ncbi:MAG: ATP-binding cassette domain-containing protein, partial [Candidatus Puniceispirillum sp.]
MTANVIEVNNVSKSFGGVHANVDISMTVESGSITGIIGPNGCGKSTTLRMLAGLEEITDGDISIDGVTVNHLPAGARGLGMVFQSYALY